MAKALRVVLNHKGIDELLHSPGVRRDLERRARQIAEAAGDGMETYTDNDRTRVRTGVVTATNQAKAAEARRRALSRAVDAGRR